MNQQIYRIEIHSSDVQAGGFWYDGWYNIDLPIIIPQGYQYIIESFSMNKETRPYAAMQLSIGYPQANTYSTNSKSQTTVIHAMSLVGVNRIITTDSIGIPIPDVSMFRANRLKITINAIDGLAPPTNFYAVTQVWCMILLIYPIKKSD